MVRRHLSHVERFVCLTDMPVKNSSVECVRLQHGWPGWWSKIEAFSPRLAPEGDRVLYIDLDTCIVGDLSAIASCPDPFLIMGDVYRRPPKSPQIQYQSSIMAWTAGPFVNVYSDFVKGPAAVMEKFRVIGDQGWIQSKVGSAALWENVVPNQVVSFKKDCRRGLPKNARVVVFHGVPKPWAVRDPWMVRAYRSVEPAHA